jgi:GNAT superfamily N-acetyltransferase
MKLAVEGLDVEVREGTIEDVPMLLSFIRDMAAFERLTVTATEDLLKESLFGPSPAARTLFAFAGGRPIAYVVYFFSFSTFEGRRGLWLEDLFIAPAFRGKGVGGALMVHLARVARAERCGRFEWTVLDWNENAIRFYKGLGAEVLDEWRVCRLGEEGIAQVAARQPSRAG